MTSAGNPTALPQAPPAPEGINLNDIWKEIQDIKGSIPLLPLAIGATIAPAISRVSNLTQVGSAAEAGTCRVVSGNSHCSSNPLQQIKQNSDDILKGLDALTQAGQGALLTAMNNTLNILNTKVADVAAIGSLGSAINNIMNYSGVGRIIDAVTMVGVIHNAAIRMRQDVGVEPDPIKSTEKQAQLEELKQLEYLGIINLYYLDETG